jgi:hypothetical protein
MASRKSDGADAWRGAVTQPNGALAYGAPGYPAPAYPAPAYAAAPAYAPAPQMAPVVAEQPWLVLVGAGDQRTVQTAALRAALQARAIAPETLVWRAGMSNWAPVGSIGELVQAAAPAPAGWDVPQTQPSSAQQAAQQYLSARGPGLGDTTTYAAWDPPQGRVVARASAPATNITSELLATGMVVFGIVMFTLYVLSLGGAFEAGGGAHASSHEKALSTK